MRKNYLSKQFSYTPVAGTLSTKEDNGLISKFMKLPNYLVVDNSSMVYYQKENKEQLFLTQELSNSPIIFSLDESKSANHKLYLDNNQTVFEKEIAPKWIMEIDLEKIITDYSFSLIKFYRGFEGVRNINTSQLDVDNFIKDYIKTNVYKQYVLNTFSLYVRYNDLKLDGGLIGNNTFDTTLIKASDILKSDITIEFNSTKTIMYVRFVQDKPTKEYNFNFYFDFEMIKNKEVIRQGSDFLTGKIEKKLNVPVITSNEVKEAFLKLENQYLVPLTYEKINDYEYLCAISPYKYSVTKNKSAQYRIVITKRESILFDRYDRSLHVLIDKVNMFFEGTLKGIE